MVAVEPAEPSGRVGAPKGERGWVGGLRETVAFGRTPVFAAERGAVGEAVPRGALAVLSGMVGAPIGELVVANFMVGVPVGVGTSGLVAEPERGMVGAPVPTVGLLVAGAVGVRGMVGVPVGARDLMGGPAGALPGAALLIGIVGAGIGG